MEGPGGACDKKEHGTVQGHSLPGTLTESFLLFRSGPGLKGRWGGASPVRSRSAGEVDRLTFYHSVCMMLVQLLTALRVLP